MSRCIDRPFNYGGIIWDEYREEDRLQEAEEYQASRRFEQSKPDPDRKPDPPKVAKCHKCGGVARQVFKTTAQSYGMRWECEGCGRPDPRQVKKKYFTDRQTLPPE